MLFLLFSPNIATPCNVDLKLSFEMLFGTVDFFPIFIALVAQCFYAQRILNLFISAERTQQLISLINANAFHIWHLSYGLNARRQQIPKIIGLPIPVFCMIARLQFYL